MERKMEKTVDEILAIIGPFNKYQWCLMLLLCYCMMNMGLQALTMTFIANDPGWKCVSNSSSCNFTELVITANMEKYEERCIMQRTDWVFSESSTSIVTEYELVCDRSILKNIATSMVYLGWFFGAIIFGYISDKWGRKIALLISMSVMSISGVISSFVGVFWLFCLLKTLVGFGIGGAMMCIFILNTEFVGIKKRPFAGIFVWNFFTIGVCLVSLFAYLIKDWKYLNLATSAPGLLILVIYFFLPESVRWLIVNDQHEKAIKVLKKVSKLNGRPYPTDVVFKKKIINNESGNIVELFHGKLLAYVLVSMFVWFACSMVYYGVSLSTGKLGGNMYIVFFLTSIIAIPANFAATYTIGRFGRKKSLILTIFGTAVSMIGAALMPTGSNGFIIGRVILAMLAKFLITIGFNAAYLITFELLPTTLRNVGMGLSSAAARLGSFSASYVIYLSEVNRILPYIIIALVAVLSAGVSFVLPETKDKPTQETVEKDNNEMAICKANFVDVD